MTTTNHPPKDIPDNDPFDQGPPNSGEPGSNGTGPGPASRDEAKSSKGSGSDIRVAKIKVFGTIVAACIVGVSGYAASRPTIPPDPPVATEEELVVNVPCSSDSDGFPAPRRFLENTPFGPAESCETIVATSQFSDTDQVDADNAVPWSEAPGIECWAGNITMIIELYRASDGASVFVPLRGQQSHRPGDRVQGFDSPDLDLGGESTTYEYTDFGPGLGSVRFEPTSLDRDEGEDKTHLAACWRSDLGGRSAQTGLHFYAVHR